MLYKGKSLQLLLLRCVTKINQHGHYKIHTCREGWSESGEYAWCMLGLIRPLKMTMLVLNRRILTW